MLSFVAIFTIKAYIVMDKYPSTTSNQVKMMSVVDLSLMIGSILIFSILTSQTCFNKCFLVFGTIYNLSCTGLLVWLFIKYENFDDLEHLKLTQMMLLAHLIATVLAAGFLIYVLFRVIFTGIKSRKIIRLEAIDRNNLSNDAEYSTATVDETPSTPIYSASMPRSKALNITEFE